MEQINTWLDVFRAILVRFEINAVYWKSIEFNGLLRDFTAPTLNKFNN